MTTVQSRFDLDAVLDGVGESVQDPTADPITLGGTLQGSYDTLVDHLGLASGDSQTVKYLLVHDGRFEIGLGELTEGSPDTLSRDLILESTENGEPLEDFTGTSSAKVGLFRETGPEGGKVLESFSDVFGKLIADGRRNELDLGSHYEYSPERWRVRRDGSRQFPEYNSVSGFTDNADHWDLAPAQGETLVLESMTRPRYTVQYSLARTLAPKLSRQLESGDQVRVGHFDGDDGWFLEKNDTHGSGEGDLVCIRDSSEVYRNAVSIPEPLTEQQTRILFAGPWYDIGRTILGQSFAINGFQRNPIIGRGSSKNRGPRTANLPMRFEITRGGSASAITLECGSAGVVTQGRGGSRSRVKPFTFSASISSSGVWEPLLALRISPDNPNVNVQLSDLQILAYSANSDVELSARGFAPEHVHESDGTQLDDADFDPTEVSVAQNTALQISEAVTEVIRADGSTFDGAIDPGSDEKMGGFQVGYDKLIDSNSKSLDNLDTPRTKNEVSPLDIVVIMGFAGSAAGDVEFAVVPEEDW